MKIAVTFENGKVFQHFGHTEAFKIYTAEDGKILSAEVIGTDGNGHEALADFLADKGVEVVICGGLGSGAKDALTDAGIEVISGAEGPADDAVEEYLAGALVSAGVNCDHHDHEEAEEGGCSGHCSGCGGGCGHSLPPIEGKNVGKTCKTHYRGTLADGTQFDSSYDRGEPLEFVCGAGMMIRGYDEAVANMEVGESIDICLLPDQAYGEYDPRAVFPVEIKDLPGAEEVNVGDRVYLYNSMGQPMPVKVLFKDAEVITFDANHELAGKTLCFHIELVSAE